MEKKAARLGKFNVVDIIAVILVVLVIAFAAFKLLGRGGGAQVPAETVDLTYVYRVENVPLEAYENCLEHIPSTLMANGELARGQVESVRKEPYYVLGPDGQWVEDPRHVTLYFTVTAQVDREAVMTNKLGTQEVRIGKEDHILKTEYLEFDDGMIVEAHWGK